MGKGPECAPRHPLRPSGFGEAVPFLDLGGEGRGGGGGRSLRCRTARAPCPLLALPGSSRGETGCGAPGCFSRPALFFPPLFLVLGKVRGWGWGRSDHFAPSPARLSPELPSLPSPFRPRSCWDGGRMTEKLDRVALSTSVSSANLFRDWTFKALFVRKDIFHPPG